MKTASIRTDVWAALLLAFAGCSSERSISVELAEAQDKIDQGDAYYERGMYAEAIPMYEDGLAVRPKQGEAYKRLAVCYEQIGVDPRAIRTYKTYLAEVDTRDGFVLVNLARLYEKRGALEDALAAYRRLLEVSPELQEIREHIQRLEAQLQQPQK